MEAKWADDASAIGAWTPRTVEGRWCGFGPYYAMFPVGFARRQIAAFTETGDRVLDPFCGRGTVPFVAQVTGRESLGTDVNPVAWVYSSTKLDPATDPAALKNRVAQILHATTSDDRQPDNEFQTWAWHPDVLAFLKAARRLLDWRNDKVDRTLMGLVLVHLHAKLGEGLSNQLRQAKSMAPEYSIEWWRSRDMRPPTIDLISFFERKLAWRYAKGVPRRSARSEVVLGDARQALGDRSEYAANFVLTSPPYFGLTNYEYDNWIRLWMLGGPDLPKHSNASRFTNKPEYSKLLHEAFDATARASAHDAVAYVRTGAQDFTLETTVSAMAACWPEHYIFCKFDRAEGPTQTALFGHKWHKAGEVDIFATPSASKRPPDFSVIKLPGEAIENGEKARAAST